MVIEAERKELFRCALTNKDFKKYYDNHPDKEYARLQLIDWMLFKNSEYTDEEYHEESKKTVKLRDKWGLKKWEYELKTLGQENRQYGSFILSQIKKIKKKN